MPVLFHVFSLLPIALATLAAPARSEPFPWTAIESWGYQLQDLEPRELAASPFRLLVIDYSRDGTDQGAFTRAEVESLRRSLPGGRRVVAYLSIGEAEDYRYYWKPQWEDRPPSWLEAENSQWKGNYKVEFWHPEWRSILYGSPEAYVDRILAAGFDGIYLDIIDAYEFHEEHGVPDARERMIALVSDLASYARVSSRDPSFGVFPQNCEELLGHPDYLKIITGIGREETYYGHGGEDEASTPRSVTRGIERRLDRAREEGKLVLTIDYTTMPSHMRKAHRRAAARGYLEYCGERALDQLVPQAR